METKFLATAAEYGIAVLAVAALVAFGYYMLKNTHSLISSIMDVHREERKEWREAFTAVHQKMDERQRETNDILQDLTSAFKDTKLYQSGKITRRKVG
jgi:hypothetical protein